jgi:nicotinamide-nucleotide amidase
VRTCLVTVGDELLSGRTVNSNAAYIGKKLADLGAPVELTLVVGDEVAEIAAAVRHACADHDVVVITGGLGPTHDDVTLDGISSALSLTLKENQKVLEAIQSRYRQLDRAVPKGVMRMARVPKGAEVLDNHWGTAPGLHMVNGRTHIFVLPGVPREMRGLLDNGVLPLLAKLPGLTPVYVRALVTAGLPESSLSEKIADLIPAAGSPIKLAFLPGYNGVELRLSSSVAPPDVDRLAAQISERIGAALVGEAGTDDLLAKLAQLLTNSGSTLATAESCTGGLLGKLLTDRAGSSDYYLGGVIAYANSAKQSFLDVPSGTLEAHGAVSAETAEAMATGARARFGATYALSITGIAGPGGGTPEKPVGLIYLGLAWPGGQTSKRLQLTKDREQNRERSAYSALDFLRRHILAQKSAK